MIDTTLALIAEQDKAKSLAYVMWQRNSVRSIYNGLYFIRTILSYSEWTIPLLN